MTERASGDGAGAPPPGRKREPPGSNRHRDADERIRRKHTCLDARRLPRTAAQMADPCLPLEASVRRRWRESSKRSSASVRAGVPFRGKGIAGSRPSGRSLFGWPSGKRIEWSLFQGRWDEVPENGPILKVPGPVDIPISAVAIIRYPAEQLTRQTSGLVFPTATGNAIVARVARLGAGAPLSLGREQQRGVGSTDGCSAEPVGKARRWPLAERRGVEAEQARRRRGARYCFARPSSGRCRPFATAWRSRPRPTSAASGECSSPTPPTTLLVLVPIRSDESKRTAATARAGQAGAASCQMGALPV